MFPDDPFDREGRWLGWYKDNERFYSQLARDLKSKSAADAENARRAAERYAAWRTAIEAKLPRGTVTPKPNLPEILTELGHLQLYAFYRGVSQVAHAEPDALECVRRTEYDVVNHPGHVGPVLPVKGQTIHFGSFVEESDWTIPLRMAAWGVLISAPMVLARLGATAEAVNRLFEEQDRLHPAIDLLQRSLKR
ncbi:MAG TPA: hypothetical protein VN622_06945 [Clostridia bacterium]|nr:hypothetical protein [Clostridia bacterium]